MDNTLLRQLGLSEHQIAIYEHLLASGAQKAGTIAKNTPLKRGLVYKTLEDLVELGIIEKNEPESGVATFVPLHPSALKGLAESRVRTAQDTQNYLESEIGTLISQYNLTNNKPGIEFYEEEEGVRKVTFDTLTSKTNIYTYTDLEQVDKYVKKMNEEYKKQREKLDLGKKILLVDSDYTKKAFANYDPMKTNLDVRLVKGVPHFAAAMQIYDNKVSYVTLSDEKMIGIIIQDKSIYDMHKALFKSMWKNAAKLDTLNKPTP
jgi:sugar-specific transcriptional regulator TrmB